MNWRTRLQTGKATALSLMAAALMVATITPAVAAPPAAAPVAQTDDGDDWARVQAAGKIVVGVSADYPPFEFYDSNYQLDGFDIALFKAIAQQMGVTVEFNDFAFDGLLTTVRLKQVDAAISAISVTANRRQLVDFSNLYYVGSDAALVKAANTGTILSATDLQGLKVGVQKGSTYQNWVQESAVEKGIIPQANLVPFDNVDAMITNLRSADGIDVAVLGSLPAQQYDARFSNIRTAGSNFNRQQFGIAARNGSTLVAQFNAALAKVQANGTYARLAQQYLQARSAAVLPNAATAKVNNADVADAVTTAKINPSTAATNTVSEAAAPVAPVCENGMAFVADLNLDDKNMTAPPVLQLNQSFSKGWRLRNAGTCAWQPNFTVAYVNGNRDGAQMQGKPIELGKAVQPGETIDVSANLVAPNSYGTFQGFWKMRDTNGQYFGEVFWVGIQIPNPNPPPPPPPPPTDNTFNPNLRADAAWIKVGQCNTIRWDVDNINAAFFVTAGNATGVGGHDSRSVCPTATTTYVLRVIGRNNVSTDFPIVINVDGSSTPATGINFWVDNTTINTGQCTNLRWNTQNAQAAYLNQGSGEALVGLSAVIQVCPPSNNVYTLRVIGSDGSQQSPQVTVNVVNTGVTPPVITSFTTNSNRVPAGNCIPISWTSNDTSNTQVALNGAVQAGNLPANHSVNICLFNRGIQQLTLTAFGNGQVSQQMTVEVY